MQMFTSRKQLSWKAKKYYRKRFMTSNFSLLIGARRSWKWWPGGRLWPPRTPRNSRRWSLASSCRTGEIDAGDRTLRTLVWFLNGAKISLFYSWIGFTIIISWDDWTILKGLKPRDLTAWCRHMDWAFLWCSFVFGVSIIHVKSGKQARNMNLSCKVLKTHPLYETHWTITTSGLAIVLIRYPNTSFWLSCSEHLEVLCKSPFQRSICGSHAWSTAGKVLQHFCSQICGSTLVDNSYLSASHFRLFSRYKGLNRHQIGIINDNYRCIS